VVWEDVRGHRKGCSGAGGAAESKTDTEHEAEDDEC